MPSQGYSEGVAGGFHPSVFQNEWDCQRTSRSETFAPTLFASCSGGEFQLLKLVASVKLPDRLS